MNSDLVSVFKDTLNICSNFPRTHDERYNGVLLTYSPTHAHNTTIVVKNTDCIDECINLIRDRLGDRVGLLNMASGMCAGGGVAKGSCAQEEEICRRTSLYPRLKKHKYPLAPMELIFSPDVEIIKSADYHRLPTCVTISGVISMAAIRRPFTSSNNDSYKFNEDAVLMRNKIRMVLQTAHYHHINTLVLGAWGCGAFRNPAKEVAQIFRDLLVVDGAEFKGAFKHITFAILEHETHRPYQQLRLNDIFTKALL